MVPAAIETATRTSTATVPAAAVATSMPSNSADRRARSSPTATARATSPQTSPQPAMGSPVAVWIAVANPESQSALQLEASPSGQKTGPPLRELSSSVHRKSPHNPLALASAQRATSARFPGARTGFAIRPPSGDAERGSNLPKRSGPSPPQSGKTHGASFRSPACGILVASAAAISGWRAVCTSQSSQRMQ